MYISTHFPSCFLSQHQCLIHEAVNGGEHSIDDVEGANDFYLIPTLLSSPRAELLMLDQARAAASSQAALGYFLSVKVKPYRYT